MLCFDTFRTLMQAKNESAVDMPAFTAEVFGLTLVGKIEWLVDDVVVQSDTNQATMTRYVISPDHFFSF